MLLRYKIAEYFWCYCCSLTWITGASNLNTWKQNQSAHSFYATEDTAEVVKSYETQLMLLYVLGLFFKVSSPLALENS